MTNENTISPMTWTPVSVSELVQKLYQATPLPERLTLAQLADMTGDELEEYRQRGREYRYILSCSVMRHLVTPNGWLLNAEYATEYGGSHPVLLHYCLKPGIDVYVTSASDVMPAWAVTLLTGDGQRLVLHADSRMNAAAINAALARVDTYYRAGFETTTSLVTALRMGGGEHDPE